MDGKTKARAIEEKERDLDRLRAAAEAADITAFASAYQTADQSLWSAVDAATAVRLALRVGAYRIASGLAVEAGRRHPESTELKRFADVLAPHGWARTDTESDPSVTTDTQWFAQHSAQYRGQWVAVKNGQLMGAAATVQELQTQVPDWSSATVTKINW